MSNNISWIHVDVRSGLPVSVSTFSNEEKARNEEAKLRKKLNLENDEAGIFEITIKKENN
jgi:hypothetical protein